MPIRGTTSITGFCRTFSVARPGFLLYDAQPGQRAAVFEHFDAFGVRVGVDSTWSGDYDASRYRWRSQEGSETDDLAISDSNGLGPQPPALVYMQTRHYDPGLGRLIMADSIPMGAFSPQGLNRYAYYSVNRY